MGTAQIVTDENRRAFAEHYAMHAMDDCHSVHELLRRWKYGTLMRGMRGKDVSMELYSLSNRLRLLGEAIEECETA